MKSLRVALRQPTSLFKGGKKRIKRSRTFFLNSVNSFEIPPACLRQPTSLYKGGKKLPNCFGEACSLQRRLKSKKTKTEVENE